jgi:pimeloyl-ACP methyl ester carboxylesterase
MKTKINMLAMLLLTGCISFPQNNFTQHYAGKVQANGIDIAYESFGAANSETFLFITGIGAQLTMWPTEFMDGFVNKGYRVICFDNRDVGLSTKMDTLGMPDWAAIFPKIGTCETVKLPYTLNDMAKDAIGLMDALKINKAHILGASMGGAIAQIIAINYPERILSLTSIMASSGNPALPPGNPNALKEIGAPAPDTQNAVEISNYLFSIYKVLDSPLYPTADSTLLLMAMNSVKRSWYPNGLNRQAAAVIIADHCDRREQLSKIKVPTIIIHGEADPIIDSEAAKELAAAIPNTKLITFKGMSHSLPPALISKMVEGIVFIINKKNNK